MLGEICNEELSYLYLHPPRCAKYPETKKPITKGFSRITNAEGRAPVPYPTRATVTNQQEVKEKPRTKKPKSKVKTMADECGELSVLTKPYPPHS